MSEKLGKLLYGIIKSDGHLREYSRLVLEAVDAGDVRVCSHQPIRMARCNTLTNVGVFKYERESEISIYNLTERGTELGLKLMAERQRGPSIGFSQMKAPDDIVPLDEPKPREDEIIDLTKKG